MRNRSILPILPLAAALCLGAFQAGAGEILADDLYGESYHADSYGNLVIYSAAGYKRIIVGKGHVLAEFRAQRGESAGPSVVYTDEDAAGPGIRRCHRLPGLVKGRSHMYGLPDHVVPTPGRVVCR